MQALQNIKAKGLLDRFTVWNIVLGFATALGAFGGMPAVPKAFEWLTSWIVFKWVMVFVLIYQGGGGEDVFFSLAITLIVFIIYVIVRLFEGEEEEEKQ